MTKKPLITDEERKRRAEARAQRRIDAEKAYAEKKAEFDKRQAELKKTRLAEKKAEVSKKAPEPPPPPFMPPVIEPERPKVLPYREVVKLPSGKGSEIQLHMSRPQVRAWNSEAREIVMLLGSQSGKTCFGPDWLYREMQRKGPGDYLIVTATYPLLQLKLLPEFLLLFQDILHLGKWKDSDKVFEVADGKTRVIVASATSPESIESATAKAAWLDEAGQKQFKREAREAVMRRLMLHQGRVLYTTTPYGLGWLKTELYDRAKEPGSNIEVITGSVLENPTFPREEYERGKRTMPPWKFAMFYEGRFERPVGVVYDAFDETVHKIPRFVIPRDWPVYVGHDFGGANPAAMFYAQDPSTGYFYAWQCYKPGPGRSTYEHVQEFKKITAGMTVLLRSGGSHQEDEIRQGYTSHGWPITEPKVRDVTSGIDRVYALHKLGKLFVFSDLEAYLDEKLSYSYKLDDNYQPTDEIENKNDYHLMDAERYGLSGFTPETVKRRSTGRPVNMMVAA